VSKKIVGRRKDDVSKMRMVAEALEKKGIKAYVIFSKLGDLTPQELERCRGVNEEYRTRLIILTARELEPYHVYERTAKEFDIQPYAVTLDDMTQITHTVFYEQRRHKAS